MAIWNILRSFGIFYVNLVIYVVAIWDFMKWQFGNLCSGNLVIYEVAIW
jgi:hypothetical protein